MDLHQNYMIHIDNLRINMKIKEKNLVYEICSDRQYRRYLCGDSQPSQRTLNSFCERLRITPNDFYSSYYREHDNEYQDIVKIYHSLQNKSYPVASKMLKDYSTHHFLSTLSNDFYKFCTIYYNHAVREISSSHAHKLYSKLIDYPILLSKKHLSFIELISLVKIADIESKSDSYLAAEHLHQRLKTSINFYISSNHRYILPTLYVEISRIYWRRGMQDTSELITNEGINYSLTHNDTRSLPELYYLKSYFCYNKGDYDLSYKYASKCLNLLRILDKREKRSYYHKILLKDFSQTFIDKLNLI